MELVASLPEAAKPEHAPEAEASGAPQNVPEPVSALLASDREIEYLRTMLEEEKRAAQLIRRSSAELERQLTEVRAELTTANSEIAKSKKLYAAGPKGSRSFSNQAAEIANLRASLAQAKQHLSREQQIRENESKQAARQVNALSVELAAVHANAAHSGAEIRHWGRWRLAAIFAAFGVACLTGGVLVSGHQLASLFSRAAPKTASPGSGPVQRALRANGGLSAISGQTGARHPKPGAGGGQLPPEPVGRADFSGAINRLDSALAAFPEPEEVLRAVYRSSRECALVWNDGHPALLYGSDKNGALSLAAAVSNCAQAIEQLH